MIKYHKNILLKFGDYTKILMEKHLKSIDEIQVNVLFFARNKEIIGKCTLYTGWIMYLTRGNSEYFPFVYKKNSNKCFFTELL